MLFEGTVPPNYYITNNNCQADQTPDLVQGVHPSEARIKDFELVGTFPQKPDLRILCGTVPPDRTQELCEVKEEIMNLKHLLSTLTIPLPLLHKPEQTFVPLKKYNVCTVPPDNGVARSTKRRREATGKARKGVEPAGYNGKLWKSIKEMQLMFSRGKLKRGTVLTTPTLRSKKIEEEKSESNKQPKTSRVLAKNLEKLSGMPGRKVEKLSSDSRMGPSGGSSVHRPGSEDPLRR